MANRIYNKQVSPKGYKMGGRVKKMGGGSLKAVPAGNKGLKKLPTEVRNKMGFMKKGGRVGLKKGSLVDKGSGKVLDLKKIYMASPEDAKKAMKRALKKKK